MYTDEQTYFAEMDSFMTLRHLTLQGTNFEIGQQLGKVARVRYGKTPTHYRANPIYASARRLYLQRNYPLHWERMRGIADVFDVDPNDDHYDLSGLQYNTEMNNTEMMPPSLGCSVVYYPPSTTATGHGCLSRNYDFATGTMAEALGLPESTAARRQRAPAMSEPYLMAWYPADGGYASLAMHSFDLLCGTLDGMNSQGLVVSILADLEMIGELMCRKSVTSSAPQPTRPRSSLWKANRAAASWA